MGFQTMIFYTAEQGQELLNRFSLANPEGVDFALHTDQAVQIVFSVVGLKPPTQEDLNSFNKAMRIFSLDIIDRNTPHQASHYKLTIRAKRQKADNGTFSDLSGNEAVPYCFTQAQRFLAALAIATNTILFWRDLRTVPIAVSSVGSAMPEIEFTDLFKVFSSPITLHAGHLYKAIEIFGHLHLDCCVLGGKKQTVTLP